MDNIRNVPQAHSSQEPYSSNQQIRQEYAQWHKKPQKRQNESVPGLSNPAKTYGIHSKPQQNTQNIYGTTYEQDYRTYQTNNQGMTFENPQLSQSAIYGERPNLSHSIRDVNLPKTYNTETYEDYGWQNSQTDPYRAGLHQAQMQSETEVFRKQYNEIQQMKLQQQMLYQTQAQIQQQHKFAQRQLLLQQMHGVRPPPNILNMQESDIISNSPQSPESEMWKSNQSQNTEVKSPTKSTDSSSSSRTLSLKSPTAMRRPDSKVTLSGILYKQGSDGLKVWRKRWFVLADYCLFYYKNQDEQKLLGSILLPSYKISPCTQEDKVIRKYAFKCEHTNMRTYILAASDFEQMVKWVKVLTAASLMQDINIQQSSSHHQSSQACGAMEIAEIATKVKLPTYVNAPPKPRRSNDCASPTVDQKYFIHQEESLQKTINQHPIENIYQHGRFPEKLPTQSPAQNDFYPYKAETSSKIAYNKIERRTPEAYGRSAYVVNYDPTKLGDYEDIYSSKRNNAILNQYPSNQSTSIYGHNTSMLEEYQQPSHLGPAVLRKKKMSYNNQQQNVPRPHSADFLEYEGKTVTQPKIPPAVQIKTQPQRPKSSLDINYPYDPSSDNYYTEERYAEKMREFGKYLKRDAFDDDAPSTSLYKPDNIITQSNKSLSQTSKILNDDRDPNWTLKVKPSEEVQSGRASVNLKSSRNEDDNLLRSASARLPSRENNEEDKKLQQREESMKRLLEWKQRMLQSPLARKSTPASITLGVTNHLSKASGLDRSSNYSSEDDEIATSDTQAERSGIQLAQTVNVHEILHSPPNNDSTNILPETDVPSEEETKIIEPSDKLTKEPDSIAIKIESPYKNSPEESLKSEYTDNDLDEALADYGEAKQIDKETIEDTKCSSPPVCLEEHYLPMSPRKVSLATPQETPAKNFSAFNDPTTQAIYSEDSPYVEMNSGIGAFADEGQTYELVCVPKPEHLYMELCNFASGDDKKKDILDSDSNTEEKSDSDSLKKVIKEQFSPLPDLVHNYDTIVRNKKLNNSNDDLINASANSTLKRMSISDTFRPASYYLSNGSSISNLKEKEETSDSLSLSSTDKPSSSANTSAFSSASNLHEPPSSNRYKKKTTSLMISGSRPTMHETIFRGEKIRRSRGNLFINDKQHLSSDNSTSQTFDSDSFSTCTEGRNSLSSKCDSIPSIFTSETASLSEADDHFRNISNYYSEKSFNETANSINTLEYQKWSSTLSCDKTLELSSSSHDNKSSKYIKHFANISSNTLPISHSRSYSSPANTNSSKQYNYNSSTLQRNQSKKTVSKTSLEVDEVDCPNYLINKVENIKEIDSVEEESLEKKTKDANCLNICHCRSISADQPAPYYYSDLSSTCSSSRNSKIHNDSVTKRYNIEKNTCLIYRKNDIDSKNISSMSRKGDLQKSKSVSVEFLLSENDGTSANTIDKPDGKNSTNNECSDIKNENKRIPSVTDDTVWDEDVLWRDNLRRASRSHAKSMDDLDSILNHSGGSNAEQNENVSTCKLTRKVNYVNENLIMVKESISKKVDLIEEDDDNDVYVSLACDAKIKDEGAYECLTVENYLKHEKTNKHQPNIEISNKENQSIEDDKIALEEPDNSDSDAYVEVLTREMMDANKRPLVTGRSTNKIPIRAVSPRVRWDNSKGVEQSSLAANQSWLKKMEHLAKAGELKAGDLLGRSHEELLMLLLLLRKNQASYQQTMQQCYSQLDNLKERAEFERVRAQLAAAELQHERVRPLLQLVDSMVRLGALYHQPLQRVESAHQARAALLEQLASCGPEDAALRVRQLRLLEQQLTEDAATLHTLSSGKQFVNSILGDPGAERHVETRPSGEEASHAARELDEELARVHHMLALNSKKLEETVADNARLERALLELRHRLHLAPQHAPSAAALHNELRRVQALVPGLQRQRRELGEAVAALSHRAAALAETRDASISGYMPVEATTPDYDGLENIPYSHSREDSSLAPLYVDTSAAAMEDTLIQSVQPVEKPEIKTVRIVKRESERRQRDRERLYSSNHWYSSDLDSYSADMKMYATPSTYDRLTYDCNSDSLSEMARNISLDDKFDHSRYTNDDNIYASKSTAYEDSKIYDERRTESVYGTAYDIGNLNYASKTTGDKKQYDMPTTESGGGLQGPLSPVFKSKAAKEIVTEMYDESLSYRRAVPKVKRRHFTAPSHHLSTNALNDSPKQTLKNRARDDTDLARALRGAASGAMRAPPVDIRAIDALFAAPSKISIPERYVPEKSPELTPEEMKKRLEKVESIKKMLSSSSADPSLSPDSEDKKQRDHLLHMNQILAHQVMEMSKIVAANANLEAQQQEEQYDSEEQSPDIEMPLYQQRENYFS